MPPLVSIAITTYKRPRLLLETITSILRQTLQDFEIVICDDNSLDGTEEVVRKVGDSRIRYHCNQVNLGQFKSTNRCIQLSTGKYFCWNSDDNVYLPQFLERLVGALEVHPEIGAAACSTIVTDHALRPYLEHSVGSFVTIEPSRVALLNFLREYSSFDYNPSSVVYRRDLIVENGLLNDNIWDDWAWLGRYVYRYGCIRIPEALFLYRDHNETRTGYQSQVKDPVGIMLTQYQEIFKNIPKTDKECSTLGAKIYRQLGRRAVLSCLRSISRGRFSLARKQIHEAIQAHSLVLVDPLIILTLLKWFQTCFKEVRISKAKQAAAFKRPLLEI